jgi:energy-coupling factor transport system ATP-binding protein
VRDLSITHADAVDPSPSGVSFDVHAGEVVLLLGPSGAGKSTLTLALNGLIPHAVPASMTGTVVAGDLDTSTATTPVLSTRVAMVFQDPDAQIVTGTVYDEVAFGPEKLLLPLDVVESRTREALRRVGLWERRTDNPDLLSGGGRQRLAIACALAMESPLIVLDEPTANLDPQGTEDVYTALADVVAAGDRAILLVEHNLDAAMALATRVIVLDRAGRMAFDGPPAAVLRDNVDELVAMGVWLPAATLEALRMRDAGATLDPLPLTVAELDAALASAARPAETAAARPSETAAARPSETAAARPPEAPTAGPSAVPAVRLQDPGTSAGGESGFLSGNRAPILQTSPPQTSTPQTSPQQTSPPQTSPQPTPQPRTSPPQTPVIRARGLTVRKGRSEILHGIDLDVEAGSLTAIVGANGAGKTTLIQALAGVVPPPRRQVDVAGLDPATASPRELAGRIGFVFQNPEHQFIAPTVFDELAHGLRLRHTPDDEITIRVEGMLARFGLADKADRHPFLLSGGEKRRLSVGTALISRPQVLALDEPTFGQDRARASELLALLDALRAEGTTIVIVTHDLQLVADHASHTVVLADGRVHASGPTADLLRSGRAFSDAGLRLPALQRMLAGRS